MITVEGKFLRQLNKYGYFARVVMEIKNEEFSSVSTEKVIGWQNEQVEFNWIKGAEIGANYALEKIKTKKYNIRITKILGTDSDTNPTIVGTATIFGIWEALKVKISDDIIEDLINLTLKSWTKSYNNLPTYEI